METFQYSTPPPHQPMGMFSLGDFLYSLFFLLGAGGCVGCYQMGFFLGGGGHVWATPRLKLRLGIVLGVGYTQI